MFKIILSILSVSVNFSCCSQNQPEMTTLEGDLLKLKASTSGRIYVEGKEYKQSFFKPIFENMGEIHYAISYHDVHGQQHTFTTLTKAHNHFPRGQINSFNSSNICTISSQCDTTKNHLTIKKVLGHCLDVKRDIEFSPHEPYLCMSTSLKALSIMNNVKLYIFGTVTADTQIGFGIDPLMSQKNQLIWQKTKSDYPFSSEKENYFDPCNCQNIETHCPTFYHFLFSRDGSGTIVDSPYGTSHLGHYCDTSAPTKKKGMYLVVDYGNLKPCTGAVKKTAVLGTFLPNLQDNDYIFPFPKIEAIEYPKEGCYGKGDQLKFSIIFNKNAYLERLNSCFPASCLLPFKLDNAKKYAIFKSGSKTNTFQFCYDVQDLDKGQSLQIGKRLRFENSALISPLYPQDTINELMLGVSDKKNISVDATQPYVIQIKNKTEVKDYYEMDDELIYEMIIDRHIKMTPSLKILAHNMDNNQQSFPFSINSECFQTKKCAHTPNDPMTLSLSYTIKECDYAKGITFGQSLRLLPEDTIVMDFCRNLLNNYFQTPSNFNNIVIKSSQICNDESYPMLTKFRLYHQKSIYQVGDTLSFKAKVSSHINVDKNALCLIPQIVAYESGNKNNQMLFTLTSPCFQKQCSHEKSDPMTLILKHDILKKDVMSCVTFGDKICYFPKESNFVDYDGRPLQSKWPYPMSFNIQINHKKLDDCSDSFLESSIYHNDHRRALDDVCIHEDFSDPKILSTSRHGSQSSSRPIHDCIKNLSLNDSLLSKQSLIQDCSAIEDAMMPPPSLVALSFSVINHGLNHQSWIRAYAKNLSLFDKLDPYYFGCDRNVSKDVKKTPGSHPTTLIFVATFTKNHKNVVIQNNDQFSLPFQIGKETVYASFVNHKKPFYGLCLNGRNVNDDTNVIVSRVSNYLRSSIRLDIENQDILSNTVDLAFLYNVKKGDEGNVSIPYQQSFQGKALMNNVLFDTKISNAAIDNIFLPCLVSQKGNEQINLLSKTKESFGTKLNLQIFARSSQDTHTLPCLNNQDFYGSDVSFIQQEMIKDLIKNPCL